MRLKTLAILFTICVTAIMIAFAVASSAGFQNELVPEYMSSDFSSVHTVSTNNSFDSSQMQEYNEDVILDVQLQQTEFLQSSNNEEPSSEEVDDDTLIPDQTIPDETIAEVPSAMASFAEGKLEILSIFQFSGMNPDKDLEECNDIFSVQVRNTSDQYLVNAGFIVMLLDGSFASFSVKDLPAGKSTLAFSVDNSSLEQVTGIDSVQGETQFLDSSIIACDQIVAEVDGVVITLKNLTNENLEKISVCCRCPYGEGFFGGSSYWYVVERLPAHGTVILEALDCILGTAEVIRIIVE